MKEQIIGIILITLGVIANNKDVQSIWLSIIKKFLPHDAVVRNQIQSIINKLQTDIGATRVNFWQFNNGTKSELGYSYKYCSVIYESHPEHLRSIKRMFKNIPVEDYIPFIKQLQESDKYLITHKDSSMAIVRASYDLIGTKSGVDYKIDNRDVYKGILSVTFNDLPCKSMCNNECGGNCDIIKRIETTSALINQRIKMLKRINK